MSYLDDEATKLKGKRDKLAKELDELKDKERILMNGVWLEGGMEAVRKVETMCALLPDDDEDWEDDNDDEDEDWDDEDDEDDDWDDDWDDEDDDWDDEDDE